MQVSRDDIVAYRLSAQLLDERLGARDVTEPLSTTGIRNTPSGSALVALSARISGFSVQQLQRAVQSKAIIEVLSLRGLPHLIPARDLPVFTTGAATANDESLMAAMPELGATMVRLRSSPRELLREGVKATATILTDKMLTKGELSTALTKAMPQFSAHCESCKAVHINDSFFKMIGVTGVYCLVRGQPGQGREPLYARTDQYLGKKLPATDPTKARQVLTRRFIHAYGPTSPRAFADWAGLVPSDASESFKALQDELEEVYLEEERLYMRVKDMEQFENPVPVLGVRFLPPGDPYLLGRDHDNMLPDTVHQKTIWPGAGNTGGALLYDGEIVAGWTAVKDVDKLNITLQPFIRLSRTALLPVKDEAHRLAQLKGCKSGKIILQ